MICPSLSGWHGTCTLSSPPQGVAVGLYLLQPFRLMVGDGDGFAFYPRRCHWAISVTAFQAGEVTIYTPSPNA